MENLMISTQVGGDHLLIRTEETSPRFEFEMR